MLCERSIAICKSSLVKSLSRLTELSSKLLIISCKTIANALAAQSWKSVGSGHDPQHELGENPWRGDSHNPSLPDE